MASTPVGLTIDRDTITLNDLTEIVRAFTDYLTQVDLGASLTGRRTLDFRLVSLSYGSPVHLVAVAEPKEDSVDTGPEVLAQAIKGIRTIGAGRPVGFRDEALEELRTLAEYGGNGTHGISIEAPTLSLRAQVPKVVATQVERVLSQGEAIGAIEGQLDTISVHAQPFFTLYDALTGRGVRCYFTEDRRAKVIAALGKKVIAHGRLRRDSGGHPKELRDLDHFAELGRPAGSLDGLPGVYAGLDVPAYLKDIRR